VVATECRYRTDLSSGIHYFRYEAKEVSTLASYTYKIDTYSIYPLQQGYYYDNNSDLNLLVPV